MASQGETTYNQFIVKLHSKVSSRFIHGHDVQHMGRFFWGLLTDEFKEEAKEKHGRNAFWSFYKFLKECLINRDLEFIIDLWVHFNQNAKNLFENFYDNNLNMLVSNVL